MVGELHPRLVEAWDLRTRRVVVAEVSIAALSGGQLRIVESEPLPHAQPIERDVTVDVPDAVTAGDATRAVLDSGGSLLESAALVGTYRGHPLPPDMRSLTFRMLFAAPDRVPGDAEVEAAIGAITGALEHRLGGRIRS